MTLGPLMCDVDGTQLDSAARDLLGHPFVGGVILFSRNYEEPAQLEALIDAIHAVREPPLLVAVDQEGGRIQRFRESFTNLPAAHLIGRQYDIDAAAGRKLAETVGWLMAAELLAVGVDLSFAPVVDLDWGLSEVIGDRAFHRDPDAVCELAIAFVSGMRDAGMAATGKHFPGHGHVVADSHHAIPVDRRPWEEMLDDLMPFERLIDAGLQGVMTAHVAYPAVDDKPATFSTIWIKDTLRDRFHFSGPVFSDDLSMAGAAVAGDGVDRARAALDAGCDMILVCNDRPSVTAIIDELGDRNEPLSQVRLASLHGKKRTATDALRETDAWLEARSLIGRVLEQPQLKLDA